MSSIAQKNGSVSSPLVSSGTSGQWNQQDSLQLPVVCVGCYAEANRELPPNCQLSPCPKHAPSQHTSIVALADKAFVARLEYVCTNIVNSHAPVTIINPLRNALTVEALSIALSVAEFWLSPTWIEVQR